MRTYCKTTLTNRNVFGLGQDRVVSSWNTCAHAAQHLFSRHAELCARGLARALKRRGSDTAVMADAVLKAMAMCLAITGPQWQPVRHTSPVLVMA